MGTTNGRTYLHEFHRPDEDEEFHDHPWPFDAYILIGGYDEQRFVGFSESGHKIKIHERCAGDFYHIKANTFHRISALHTVPTWTVVRTGPKEKSWSFLNAGTGKLTPWREFIRGKGVGVVG